LIRRRGAIKKRRWGTERRCESKRNQVNRESPAAPVQLETRQPCWRWAKNRRGRRGKKKEEWGAGTREGKQIEKKGVGASTVSDATRKKRGGRKLRRIGERKDDPQFPPCNLGGSGEREGKGGGEAPGKKGVNDASPIPVGEGGGTSRNPPTCENLDRSLLFCYGLLDGGGGRGKKKKRGEDELLRSESRKESGRSRLIYRTLAEKEGKKERS